MAKKSVNKSALVRDYLGKYPEKGPTAIAQQIKDEKGVKVTANFGLVQFRVTTLDARRS